MSALLTPAGYVGDFAAGEPIRFGVSTHQANGTPITLAGGLIGFRVYRDGDASASPTGGVSLSVNFDSRTGYHLVTVDPSADAAFFLAGSDYEVLILGATVDGVSVAGTRLGSFSIDNRAGAAERLLLLGLAGHNRGLRDLTWDGKNLLSADICLYNSDVNAALNDGVTGLIRAYHLTNTYDSSWCQATEKRVAV